MTTAARMGGSENTAPTAEAVWTTMRALVLERYDAKAAACAEVGLSFFRIKVLRQVAVEPVTVGVLAQQLGTDPPHVSVIVDELVQRGLVERRGDPADRRRKIVSVAPEGERLATRAAEVLNTPPPALLAVPAADLAAVARVLERLL